MARIKAKSKTAKLAEKVANVTTETLEKTGADLAKQALVPFREELIKVTQSMVADERPIRSKRGRVRAIQNTGRIKDPATYSSVKSKKLVDFGQRKVLAYFHYTKAGQSRIPIRNAKKAKLTPFTYESWLEFGTREHYVGKGSVSKHHREQSEQWYRDLIARTQLKIATGVDDLGRRINSYNMKRLNESLPKLKQRLYNKIHDPKYQIQSRGRILHEITKYKGKLISPIRTKIKNNAISDLAKELQSELAKNISNVTK